MRKPDFETLAKSPHDIAVEIASQFVVVEKLVMGDLEYEIEQAIKQERKITRWYINQIGRWTSKNERPNSKSSHRKVAHSNK